jgi:hypothetical protein
MGLLYHFPQKCHLIYRCHDLCYNHQIVVVTERWCAMVDEIKISMDMIAGRTPNHYLPCELATNKCNVIDRESVKRLTQKRAKA